MGLPFSATNPVGDGEREIHALKMTNNRREEAEPQKIYLRGVWRYLMSRSICKALRK